MVAYNKAFFPVCNLALGGLAPQLNQILMGTHSLDGPEFNFQSLLLYSVLIGKMVQFHDHLFSFGVGFTST